MPSSTNLLWCSALVSCCLASSDAFVAQSPFARHRCAAPSKSHVALRMKIAEPPAPKGAPAPSIPKAPAIVDGASADGAAAADVAESDIVVGTEAAFGSPLLKPIDKREIFFKGEIDAADVLAFLDRSLDTLEDAGMHLSRLWRPLELESRGRLTAKPKAGKPRIIVVGTGWGGHAVSKVIDVDKYEVVYVSRLSYFLFTPMLCAASVGTVDVRSITESIKLANPHVTFVQGTVTHAVPEEKKLVVQCPSSRSGASKEDTVTVELEYDTLVYAAGARVGTFGVKGVEENCYCLKEVSDAQKLRSAIITRFDEATLPGLTDEERRTLLAFVVIGSGPTGIEFTAELADLLASDIPRLYPELAGLVSLRVISAADTILPMFDKVLQQKGLERLRSEGIDVLLGRVVKEVRRDAVILGDGQALPFGLCFWAGGTAPRSLTLDMIKTIPGQAEGEGAKRGLLTVDSFLRVKGTNGTILALGDAAKIEGGRQPQTGQVAAQEGAYAARLLNRGYDLSAEVPEMPSARPDGDPLEYLGDLVRLRGHLKAKPFHFLNLGVLAYVGSGQALASLQGGDNTKLLDAAGKSGNLLWRSTYLVKQVSLRNRMSVSFDWLKSRLFGRDVTKL